MGVELHQDAAKRLAVVEIEGTVTQADFDALAAPLDQLIERCGTLRVLEVVRALDDGDPGVLGKGLTLDLDGAQHISHYALVTDLTWHSPLARAASAFLTCEMRDYPLDKEDRARAWISDPYPDAA